MKPATYEEILDYGKKLKVTYPALSPEDMKKVLLTHFVDGEDILQKATTGSGCIAPPNYYFILLLIVFNSLRKLFTQDKKKLIELQEEIDRAVKELNSNVC